MNSRAMMQDSLAGDAPRERTTPARIDYVLGFLFDGLGRHLAVIRKRKPAWQAGRLNVPGGKVEPGESPPDAVRREFHEETGVEVFMWEHFATLTGPDFRLFCYSARDTHGVFAVQSMEEESVFPAPVLQLLADPALLPNLRVLIPLALDTSGIAKPVCFVDERAAAA